MFQRILVPVDDNEMSRRALHAAGELASAMGAALTVIHIIEPPPTYTARVAQMLPPGEFERSQKEYALGIVEGLRSAVPDGVNAEYKTLHAERRVWREIVSAAEESKADLIVIGTHGRDGVARAVMGSVAEYVARHAPVPVMLVR